MKSFGTSVQDSRDIIDSGDSKILDYKVSTFNALIGQTLLIDLGETKQAGQKVSVSIDYKTSPTGTAFSWLTAAQTAGGALPYMYTQCEDINCRTVAPL